MHSNVASFSTPDTQVVVVGGGNSFCLLRVLNNKLRQPYCGKYDIYTTSQPLTHSADDLVNDQ